MIASILSQNSLITPAASSANEPKVKNIHDQRWSLILCGYVQVNLKGNSDVGFLSRLVKIEPNMLKPLTLAVSTHAIPTPRKGGDLDFDVEQIATVASLGSVDNFDTGVNWAVSIVNSRPSPFQTGINSRNGKPLLNIFRGIQVNVIAKGNGNPFPNINYHITLIGKIVFNLNPPVT